MLEIRSGLLMCLAMLSKIQIIICSGCCEVLEHEGDVYLLTKERNDSTLISKGCRDSCQYHRRDAEGSWCFRDGGEPTTCYECECGVKNISSAQKFPGAVGKHTEWPWFGSLHFANFGLWPFCGCTLISDLWIVSAAHCVSSTTDDFVWVNRPEDVAVSFGVNNIRHLGDELLNPDWRLYPIQQIVVHNEYRVVGSHNDIALLKLSIPAELSLFRPICLPPPDKKFEGKTGEIIGFGNINPSAKLNELPEFLKVEKVPIVNANTCMHNYTLQDVITIQIGLICAGGNGTDSCIGDSGGPLMVQKEDGSLKYELAGIASFGQLECKDRAKAGLHFGYTEVSHHRAWMDRVFKNNGGYGIMCK